MIYILKNEEIKIEVDSFGAELKSLKKKNSMFGKDTEYMWCADPAYWKRTSPVLFPLVGSLNQKSYRYQGKTYEMSQHGFARDMEFELVEQNSTNLTFRLCENEESLAKYPFCFALYITYCIEKNSVRVSWKVKNCGQDTMYFSIGGHPAFRCPVNSEALQTDYFIQYDKTNKIISTVIGEGGLATNQKKEYSLNNGLMKITEDLFNQDALVIENNQTGKVSLLTPDQRPYVTVMFDAPLFGVWSPTGKNAPFVCIEPWYGRCDEVGFQDSLEYRKWGNTLAVGKEFNAFYDIFVE